ncbi:Fe2+-dependent dioxygenase [Prochlorococcus sp. MIT 1307]|uniref:Fe2+-dependent dioxygenase n=1 Tax=Prochlorococcus sp. MIT 1307 TaxID=3096219 RepID=UPI002A75A971|nr:Fe2+-dependent dioxygenase [Prochlorococcus sp. MIT 1307]
MDYLIHTLLSESASKSLFDKLLKNKSNWQDGKRTAGSHAAKVKKNKQLEKESKIALESSREVINMITRDPLLKSFCLPRLVHGVMFSLTSTGDSYGDHVDNAYMSSGRSDLSFTLFLTDPNHYKGGELCIQSMQEEKEIKLKAGQIVIYPSTSLHCVKAVSKGERLACIGWIQSYVASNEDRNILFGLDAGARGLLAEHGKSAQLDLVFQAYNNLLRRLGN